MLKLVFVQTSFFPKEFAFTEEGLNPELWKIFDKHFEIQFPLSVPDFSSKQYKLDAKKIRKFYLNGKPVNNDTLDEMNDLMTDVNFHYGIDLSARFQATKSTGRTYFSKFSVRNDWTMSARRAKLVQYKTKYPEHSDQLAYVFRYSGSLDVLTDNDYLEITEDSMQYPIIKTLIKFYTDFAKHG